MKKSKHLRLLAVLLATCSVMAIASGCNKESTTTGSPGGQQSASTTAPEQPATAAPKPTESKPAEPEKKDYYLSGTWKMNETLVPLVELTGKMQKENLEEQLWFYAGGKRFCARVSWSFSYLNYEDGYTTKTVQWNRDGYYVDTYIEGKAFSEFTGWENEEDRTIVFVNDPAEEGKVSEEFYLWFTKNAVKISNEGVIW